MMVLDASVVVELLLGAPGSERFHDRVLDPAETRHAPELLDVEIAQVVRRCRPAGEIEADRGQKMVVDLADLPILRHSHAVLLPRI